MERRVLIPGAGGGMGNNLIRSLRAADPSLVVVGCHSDRFALKKSTAERNYLVHESTHPDFVRGLRRVIEAEMIDLLMPCTDVDVQMVSRLRRRIPCRVFLPPHAVVELCQDKYRLTTFLRSRGSPVARTYPVMGRASIEKIFRRLGAGSLLWCRVRSGAGSRGAAPVKSPEQAWSWIRYWEEMRGVAARSFTLSEYLPGRDFACQSLWKDGRLVLVKTCERLSYFGGESHPSGVSSMAALAKTVIEPRVVEACTAAVRVLDPRISGAFSVDLKENADGLPCITEINVGRFITMTNFFDMTGKHNMAGTYARLALDEPVQIDDPYDAVEDYYFLRDGDTVPGIFHTDELFEGIRDARA